MSLCMDVYILLPVTLLLCCAILSCSILSCCSSLVLEDYVTMHNYRGHVTLREMCIAGLQSRGSLRTYKG